MSTKILILAQSDLQQLIKSFFTSEISQGDWTGETANNGAEGIEKAIAFQPDVIFIDFDLPNENGFQIIEQAMKADIAPFKIVPLLEEVDRDKIALLENKYEIYDYLIKSISYAEDYKSAVLKARGFDYDTLNQATKNFILERADKIKASPRRTAQDIIDIGIYLTEIKEKLEHEKLGHDQFQNWLNRELQWGPKLAVIFMQITRQFRDVEMTNLNITPTGLFVLSHFSIPPEVREAALNRARAGEEITPKKIVEIKQEYGFVVEDEAPSPKTFSTQSWHRLGNHFLYHGSPKDDEFRLRLPLKIALLIDFSAKENQSLNTITSQAFLGIACDFEVPKSESDIHSTIVKEMLEIYTKSDDIVVFCLLPSPEYLLYAYQLDCQCYIAEPSWERCEKTINFWEEYRSNRTKLT